jgi:acetolactate synthase-1/3 small subunit
MPAPDTRRETVLELRVNNHPGVMSHVVGLFARRRYNVEAILCLPVDDGAQSDIWLLVNESDRLSQIISQVEKLADVRTVVRHAEDSCLFAGLRQQMYGGAEFKQSA